MRSISASERSADRLTIGSLLLLIAGGAFGLWLVLDFARDRPAGGPHGDPDWWLLVLVYVLGGITAVGPPLILFSGPRRPWLAGRFIWFTQGTAAWLLWPPVLYTRIVVGSAKGQSSICYFYGTPLMAVYVTVALLFGGGFRRSRRRRIWRSWQEAFGILLGMLWAIVGWFFIGLFYVADFFQR